MKISSKNYIYWFTRRLEFATNKSWVPEPELFVWLAIHEMQMSCYGPFTKTITNDQATRVRRPTSAKNIIIFFKLPLNVTKISCYAPLTKTLTGGQAARVCKLTSPARKRVQKTNYTCLISINGMKISCYGPLPKSATDDPAAKVCKPTSPTRKKSAKNTWHPLWRKSRATIP